MQVKGKRFVMANNLAIALGFFMGPVIVGRHFPEDQKVIEHSRDDLCNSLPINGTIETRMHVGLANSARTKLSISASTEHEAFDLTTPFQEVAGVQLVFASLYVFAAILPLEMPGRCFHWLSFLI